MNAALATAGGCPPRLGDRCETIDLVGNLWDIECRHQLGKISRNEYLQAIAALRGEPGRGRATTVTTRGKNDA